MQNDRNGEECTSEVPPEEEKPFKCSYCELRYASNDELQKHINGDKPYSCAICEKFFLIRAILKHHLEIYKTESPYKCDYCNKIFLTKAHLNIHKKNHTGEKFYSCEYCEHKAVSATIFMEHVREHTNGPLDCDTCLQCVETLQNLADHLTNHETSFYGEITRKVLNLICQIVKHMVVHRNERQFDSEFYQTVETTPLRIHDSSTRTACFICEKRFTTPTYMYKHLREHQEAYMCRACLELCQTPAKLKRHYKQTHPGLKRHFCPICEHSFMKLADLEKHKLLHPGGERYKCDSCFTKFESQNELTEHLNTPSEQPFVAYCRVCEKDFTRLSCFFEHRIHSMDIPLRCLDCNLIFIERSDLVVHRMAHDCADSILNMLVRN